VCHEMIFVLLRPDVTAQHITDALHGGITLRNVREQFGEGDILGILLASPHQSSTGRLLVNLVHGRTYLIICQLEGPQGHPGTTCSACIRPSGSTSVPAGPTDKTVDCTKLAKITYTPVRNEVDPTPTALIRSAATVGLEPDAHICPLVDSFVCHSAAGGALVFGADARGDQAERLDLAGLCGSGDPGSGCIDPWHWADQKASPS
jgi:hypothetical protein